MTAYLGKPTGSNVHWVWNGSSWGLLPYGGGSSGGGVVTSSLSVTQIYTFTGTTASFVVPEGVTSIDVKMWGPGGGGGAYTSLQTAGAGGFTSGTILTTPGEQFLLIVGGGGLSVTGASGIGGLGGYGNGGTGSRGDATGAGGGGYSGIFTSSIIQGNAVLIAGGGGGSSGFRTGGGGGGQTGGNSSGGGTGGTQTAGGGGGVTGGRLFGANGFGDRLVSTANDDAGGGSGYWGGGAASGDGAGGGGGSGFVHSSLTRVINSGTLQGNSGGTNNRATPPMNADIDYLTIISASAALAAPPFAVGSGGGIGQDGGHGAILIRYTVGQNVALWYEDDPNTAFITSSVAIGVTGSAQLFAGQEAFFFVSGTIGISGSNARKTIFGGDIVTSGSVSVRTFSPGAMFPTTPPPLSASWSNVTLGATTRFEDQPGRVLFLSAAAGSSPDHKVATRPVPSTPYVITAGVMPLLGFNVASSVCGIGWRESSSGRLVILGTYFATTGNRVYHAKYNTPTSFNAVYQDVPGYIGQIVWFRLEDNGTNRRVGYSTDGTNFLYIDSRTRTDFLTPDQVFIGVDPENIAAAMTIVSWKVE